MQRRWLMGWASPLAGSEEEAVAAWGRPAPDTRAAILAIKCGSPAVVRIPLLSLSLVLVEVERSRRRRRMQEKEDIFGILRSRGSSETIMSDIDVDGHLNPKCGDRHGAISTGGGSNQEKIWRNFTQKNHCSYPCAASEDNEDDNVTDQ